MLAIIRVDGAIIKTHKTRYGMPDNNNRLNIVSQLVTENTLETILNDVSNTTILPPKEPFENALLASVVSDMRKYEALKRNNTPGFSGFKRTTVKIGGVEKSAIYYKKDGSTKPTTEDLVNHEVASLAVRQLSLIAGVLNALEFSPTYLTVDTAKREKINIKIAELVSVINKKAETRKLDKTGSFLTNAFTNKKNKKNTSANFSQDGQVNQFTKELIQSLDEIVNDNKQSSKKKKKIKKKSKNRRSKNYARLNDKASSKIEKSDSVTRQIRNAERYFVSVYRNQVIIVETVKDNNSVILMDVAYDNKLTDAQRADFVKIHTDAKPLWFTRMPTWEQSWFLQMIPKAADANKDAAWAKFESINQPSTMTHIPGIKNARMNYSFLKKAADTKYKPISRSFKQASIVPRDMPSSELAVNASRNAEQVLIAMTPVAKSLFSKEWNNVDFGDMKPMIYVQSLLSDTAAGGQDNKLSNMQIAAIDAMAKNANFKDVLIIAANDPLNILRLGTWETNKSPFNAVNNPRWDKNNEVIKYAKKFASILATKTDQELTLAQIDRRNLITGLINELESVKSQDTISGRNYTAYKVALTKVLVEAMGGIDVANCMSGKDRTGVDELYQISVSLYAEFHNLDIVKYNETGDKRENFKETFALLFNSGKAQESAASNAPGAPGIKETAPSAGEMAKNIGPSYYLKLADGNKPEELKTDEIAQTAELKALDRAMGKGKEAEDEDDKILTFNEYIAMSKKLASSEKNENDSIIIESPEDNAKAFDLAINSTGASDTIKIKIINDAKGELSGGARLQNLRNMGQLDKGSKIHMQSDISRSESSASLDGSMDKTSDLSRTNSTNSLNGDSPRNESSSSTANEIPRGFVVKKPSLPQSVIPKPEALSNGNENLIQTLISLKVEISIKQDLFNDLKKYGIHNAFIDDALTKSKDALSKVNSGLMLIDKHLESNPSFNYQEIEQIISKSHDFIAESEVIIDHINKEPHDHVNEQIDMMYNTVERLNELYLTLNSNNENKAKVRILAEQITQLITKTANEYPLTENGYRNPERTMNFLNSINETYQEMLATNTTKKPRALFSFFRKKQDTAAYDRIIDNAKSASRELSRDKNSPEIIDNPSAPLIPKSPSR